MTSGVARKFSQGVRNSKCLQSSTCRPFTVPVESGTLTGERIIITCRTSSMETWQSCGDASWRTFDGCDTVLVAARTPSTYSTKNSASLLVLVSVEANTGLCCHVTRLMKLTARARGHTIFQWSAVVNILHRFRDRPLTQRLKFTQ